MNDIDRAYKMFTTTDMNLGEVCKELGLSYSTVSKTAAKQKWKDDKKKVRKKKQKKIVNKVIDRQTSSQARTVNESIDRELNLAHRIMRQIERALEDEKQLNTHLVTIKGEKLEGSNLYNQWIEERQYSKIDTKELVDLVNALGKTQEIIGKAQRTMSRYEEEKINIEKERLEIERKKLELLNGNDEEGSETGIVEMPSRGIADYEAEAAEFMKQFEEKEAENEG